MPQNSVCDSMTSVLHLNISLPTILPQFLVWDRMGVSNKSSLQQNTGCLENCPWRIADTSAEWKQEMRSFPGEGYWMALGMDKLQKHQLFTWAYMFWALNILQSYNWESDLPMQPLGLLPTQLLGCSSLSSRSVRLRGAVFCPWSQRNQTEDVLIALIKLSVNGHPHQIQSEYPQGGLGNVCTCVHCCAKSMLDLCKYIHLVPLTRKTACWSKFWSSVLRVGPEALL